MRPIADYGLIGDTRTAALTSSDGSLDWLCVPRFDGDPVFGSLVGGPAAGAFRLGPTEPAPVVDRRYRGHSATLETTWATPRGRLTLTEGMVAEVAGHLLPATLLVRRLSIEGAPAQAEVHFDPRLGERHRPPRVRRRGPDLVCEWGALAMSLTCDAARTSRWGDRPCSPSPRATGDLRRDPRPSRAPHPCRPGPGVDPAGGGRVPLGRLDRGDRPRHPVPRCRRAQSPDAAAPHVLSLGRAGRRPDHLAARTARGCPQLGLPLRLAP